MQQICFCGVYYSMKSILRRAALAAVSCVFFLSAASAEKTPLENVYHYTLDNGLNVFVVENHAAPLAYIEIAVKAGGITQTAENAGLFHLYEHMMFKGNTKYRDSAAVQRALSDMGVPEWNGSTGSECVNYYFTVPSGLIEKGMEFWSCAIREPLLDPVEFESEKKVVLSEIEGESSDPAGIVRAAIQKMMFPEYPWRVDAGGNPAVVRNATLAQIKDIQQKYYVPDNAALFVAGDVDHDTVYRLAQKLYGSWKKSDGAWKKADVPQSDTPFAHNVYMVMPFDKVSPQIAEIDVFFRGPDAERDEKSTYGMDMIGYFFDDPDGIYKTAGMSVPELGIPDKSYIGEGYLTSREAGVVNFTAAVTEPGKNLPARSRLFLDTVTGTMKKVRSDKNIFTKDQFRRIYQKLEDTSLADAETAERIKSNLRFWWTTVSPDYYYTYVEKMKKTGKTDIDACIDRYFTGKNALVVVLVNPAVYETQKQAFADAGFEEITGENSYWFLDPEYGAAGGKK